MAEFTQQQKTILASTARSNLVNAVAKTGKTTLLARKYLNQQEHPGANKAIFITANALATQRVLEHLQRITALSWEEDWIGTFAEIGGKLLKRYHRELSYTKPPQVVSDLAASADREAARKTAVQTPPRHGQRRFPRAVEPGICPAPAPEKYRDTAQSHDRDGQPVCQGGATGTRRHPPAPGRQRPRFRLGGTAGPLGVAGADGAELLRRQQQPGHLRKAAGP